MVLLHPNISELNYSCCPLPSQRIWDTPNIPNQGDPLHLTKMCQVAIYNWDDEGREDFEVMQAFARMPSICHPHMARIGSDQNDSLRAPQIELFGSTTTILSLDVCGIVANNLLDILASIQHLGCFEDKFDPFWIRSDLRACAKDTLEPLT